MKILVRNLSREITESELLELFTAYGAVQYCSIVMDPATGKSKGFGFVEMPRPGDAKAAIKELNARDVGGMKIRVKKAEKSEEKGACPCAGQRVKFQDAFTFDRIAAVIIFPPKTTQHTWPAALCCFVPPRRHALLRAALPARWHK